jgi:hypothetical protein
MLSTTAAFVAVTFGVGFAIALALPLLGFASDQYHPGRGAPGWYPGAAADALREYVSNPLFLVLALVILTVGFIACFLAMRWMEARGTNGTVRRLIGAGLCVGVVCWALGPMLPPVALVLTVIVSVVFGGLLL